MDFDGLTTGTGLEVRIDSDIATTGKAIDVKAGSSMDTSVFSVTKSGAMGVPFMVPLHCSRQLTATVTSLFAFQMPFKATLVEVSATARASGGTSPTLSIDVKEAGTTVLSSAMSITAGTVTVGTISDSSIADNAKITVDATIGGTSPTWDDITVLLTFERAA